MIPPINFKKWIDENRHLLKPPVGNQIVYEDTEFIIMVVGGPNARKDYHYNEGEEFFYQIEGNIKLGIIENGVQKVVEINEGEIFLLPAKVPHSPQRGPNTVGLVVERRRTEQEMDACSWYCENKECNNELFKADFHMNNIVVQLPKLMNSFYEDEALRTCNKCGQIMEVPKLKEEA
jgi:3-hydroxyanthranilate 3,4-dioxygenase